MEAFLDNFTKFLREDGPQMSRSTFGVLVSPEEYKKLDTSGTDFWLGAHDFSRYLSQVLSDPATWNESPVVISILPNGGAGGN